MGTEIVVITIPPASVNPFPVSLAGASQVLIANNGPANVMIQTTADSAEPNVFPILPAQANSALPLNITGCNDENWYVRGLVAGAGATITFMIMRRD